MLHLFQTLLKALHAPIIADIAEQVKNATIGNLSGLPYPELPVVALSGEFTILARIYISICGSEEFLPSRRDLGLPVEIRLVRSSRLAASWSASTRNSRSSYVLHTSPSSPPHAAHQSLYQQEPRRRHRKRCTESVDTAYKLVGHWAWVADAPRLSSQNRYRSPRRSISPPSQ